MDGTTSLIRPKVNLDGIITNQCVPVRSNTNVELRSEILIDKLGNTLTSSDYGIYSQTGDEVVNETRFAVIGSWLNRGVESWVEGHPERFDSDSRLNRESAESLQPFKILFLRKQEPIAQSGIYYFLTCA